MRSLSARVAHTIILGATAVSALAPSATTASVGRSAHTASSSPFRFNRLDHVVLKTRDMPEMIRFYVDILGAEPEWLNRFDGKLSHLRIGSSLIDLSLQEVFEPDSAAGRNLDHFAINVEDFNEDEARAYLEANGVEITQAGPRFGADGNGKGLYVRDPEGNEVELKCARFLK